MSAPSRRTPVAPIVLSILVLLLWFFQMMMLTGLSGSDAAGNGMAQGFTAIELVLLWILLAILVVVACVKGAVGWGIAVPTLLLLPLSGVAAGRALDLLAHPNSPPWFWPMAVTGITVPSFVGFCLWAAMPSLHAAVPARLAVPVAWAGIVVGSLAVLPMEQIREGAWMRAAEASAAWDEAYKRLPRDAPLWEWVPFLLTAQGIAQEVVLDGVRHLDRRQNDAAAMLARGDFPLSYLGRMDLTPTREICDGARGLLRSKAERLVPPPGRKRQYAQINGDVADAVAAMGWLVGYDCSCDAEASAWETMANGYADPGFDVVRLRELRDPNELGRTLRERPEQFSQLSSRSHLMAWLHYAQDPSLRERALAGARVLERRNDDAVDMLNGSEFAAWDLLIYLTDLELEATPALCEAASREVHRELARIYQPRTDDPRPYQELLERFGTGRPLPALMWLSGHGCEMEARVAEAEGLVLSYQDSPERGAMLATLGGLRREP